ncbi:MAG: hypothetical protein ACLRPU_07670, partial [Enterococcus hulanensis]
ITQGNNGGGTTPAPQIEYSYWYTAAKPEFSKHNVTLGTHRFATKEAAQAALTEYTKKLLMEGVSVSTSGVSPIQN